MNPKRIKLDALSGEIVKPIDVFICCASYEERCLSIASNLPQNSVGTAFVLENMDLARYIDTNTKRLCDLFDKKPVHVPISSISPLEIADGVSGALRKRVRSASEHYFIDITTFTHEGLLILLKVLAKIIRAEDTVQIAYTTASYYGGGENENVGDRWLSKGVVEVRTVLGYPGKHFPSNKTHLIVLVGYEHERASKLIEIIEPHSIALGYGKSGSETTEKNKDANKYFLQLVQKTTIGCKNVEAFEISCNDPLNTREAITRMVKKASSANILLAPMNNKLTTIASALAAKKREEIQICYAQASLYNYLNYSIPGNTCYLMEIPGLFD